MAKKLNTTHGIIGLVLGIITGIAGTAYSMGADKQRAEDSIAANSTAIKLIETKFDKLTDEMHKQSLVLVQMKTILERIDPED